MSILVRDTTHPHTEPLGFTSVKTVVLRQSEHLRHRDLSCQCDSQLVVHDTVFPCTKKFLISLPGLEHHHHLPLSSMGLFLINLTSDFRLRNRPSFSFPLGGSPLSYTFLGHRTPSCMYHPNSFTFLQEHRSHTSCSTPDYSLLRRLHPSSWEYPGTSRTHDSVDTLGSK